MNAIKQWFENHNISSHAIVAGLTAAFGLYVGNSEVKNTVDAILAAHPKWSSAFGLALAVYLKYSGSHSTQGQAAQLNAALAAAPVTTKAAIAEANQATPASAPVVSVAVPIEKITTTNVAAENPYKLSD